MSNYTPTTEEVRDAYEIGAAGMATYSGNGIEDDESNEFDRWLAQHDAELRQSIAADVETFLRTVHGLNEMNVVRGVRKALAGETTTFRDELKAQRARFAATIADGRP